MQLPTIIQNLNKLPQPFKRQGDTYQQFIDSFANGLAYLTYTSEEIASESTNFSNARYGWLDVWGQLFGILRNPNEADYLYSKRVEYTLLAWVGTIPAIEEWGALIIGGDIVLSENFPAAGYTINIYGAISDTSINYFLYSLNRIRPAGVPFNVFTSGGDGTYLDTIVFLDCPDTIGAYLTDGQTQYNFSLGATTNSASPLLPSYYLSDPLLNPSLA